MGIRASVVIGLSQDLERIINPVLESDCEEFEQLADVNDGEFAWMGLTEAKRRRTLGAIQAQVDIVEWAYQQYRTACIAIGEPIFPMEKDWRNRIKYFPQMLKPNSSFLPPQPVEKPYREIIQGIWSSCLDILGGLKYSREDINEYFQALMGAVAGS